MGGKLNVYGLGSLGVNVDANAVNLEDGELTKAQNVIHDPVGSGGGIRKRPGLTKVNSIAAAGSIVGAINVPLTRPSTRKFFFGRRVNSSTGGWNVSTDEFATAATTGGPDGYDADGTPRVPDKVWTSLANTSDRQFAFAGRPMVTYKNRIYYAGNDYTLGTTAPTIRMYDGTVDFELVTLPYNPDIGSTVAASAILCMIVGGDGNIYLSTYDGGSYSANTVKGRIFQFNPENGVLQQLGARFPTDGARSIYGLAWHMGRLWTGTFTGGVTASQKTYFIRPGIDTAWTQESASAGANGPLTELVSFQGQLYFLSMADAGSAAVIRLRNTAGTYSTAKTPLLNEGGVVPVMTDFGSYNHWGTAILFNGGLYASYFNWNAGGTERHARIYKFDGTSWTVPFCPAANDALSVPYHFAFVHNSKLYMASAPSYNGTTGVVNELLRTADGVTWTDVSSGLVGASQVGLGVITS